MKEQLPITPADINITAIDKEKLTDADSLILDSHLPPEQQAYQILAALKNPYHFRVGDIGVTLEFPDKAPSLQDCLISFFIRKKTVFNCSNPPQQADEI
ncbi:DUF6870 family protein [Lachnospiraceae bacterium 62-35]